MRYRRIAELGRGGMATVYLALREGASTARELVVVKEMRPDLAQEADFRRMFVEEARIASALSHPNVVRTFEAVEDPKGVYCIVMEHLDGQPLSRLRSAARRELLLPLQLHVVAQVLEGLEHVHARGLIHRDVSPQNVFVTYDGEVKILDFGIAKASDSSVHTSVGTLKGKLGYMAPEQVLGQRLDPRVDVFASGVILWEALTGRRLWHDVPEPAIIARLTSGHLPRPSEVKKDIPAALDDLVMKATATAPGDRFQSAAEMADALEAFMQRMTLRPTKCELGTLVTSLFSLQRRALMRTVDDALRAPDQVTQVMRDSVPLLPQISTREEPSSAFPEPHSSSIRREPTRQRTRALLASALAIGVVVGAAAVLARNTARSSGVVAPGSSSPGDRSAAASSAPAASPSARPAPSVTFMPSTVTQLPSPAPSSSPSQAPAPRPHAPASPAHTVARPSPSPLPPSPPPAPRKGEPDMGF